MFESGGGGRVGDHLTQHQRDAQARGLLILAGLTKPEALQVD